MVRVIAYVDGFNFYHGLCGYLKRKPSGLSHNKVDLRRLIENHLLQENEELIGARWYSAIPPNNHQDSDHQSKTQRRSHLPAT
ncbi:MAG: hypothetical protein CSB44_12785 [Gammaproteobacteria bacterium]|nr:MAG: hypothetical protein CSB44_12785 [Gammaproteobacteria bacterium]